MEPCLIKIENQDLNQINRKMIDFDKLEVPMNIKYRVFTKVINNELYSFNVSPLTWY